MPKLKSKLARRKKNKSKFIQKLKQPWRVARNWLHLSSDLMLNILQRVGVIDRLQNAQLVCIAWHEICKDPFMWRVVCINEHLQNPYGVPKNACKLIVDRSQGQLLDLAIVGSCDQELIQYIADRSSQLRRLEFVYNSCIWYAGTLSEAFKKLSLLEELSFVQARVNVEYFEAVGRYCPLLKTLKVNKFWIFNNNAHLDAFFSCMITSTEIALAIGKNLHELTHLEFIRSGMSNIGLLAILDGCCHLGSLDLSGCENLDLNGDLGKRCSQQIKYLKLPHHSLEGYQSTYGVIVDSDDGYDNDDDDDDQEQDEDGDGVNDDDVFGEMIALMNTMFG